MLAAEFRWKPLHGLRDGYLRSLADLRAAVEFAHVLREVSKRSDPGSLAVPTLISSSPQNNDQLLAMTCMALRKAMSRTELERPHDSFT